MSPSRAVLIRAAALWSAILLTLILFREVLVIFGGATLVAYLIGPLVDRIARLRLGGRSVPRGVGILVAYGLIFLAIYGFSITAVPQLYREIVRLSAEARNFLNSLTPDRIADYTRIAEAWLDSHGIPLGFVDNEFPSEILADAGDGAPSSSPRLHFDLEEAIRGVISGGTLWVKGHLLELVDFSQRLIARVLGGIFGLFFMLMVSAFLLVDVEGVKRFLRSLVPSQWRSGFDDLLSRIDEKLSGVIRGQVIICLVNGVLTLIGLLIFKVKFALILATLATVLSFIPIFGTILSTIPIVLVGLSQSFGTAMAILAWILGIHALEAYGLNPKILGDSARIHPVLIAFALLAGERSFGFVGALLAVPVASVLLATFAYFKDRADRLEEAELALVPAEVLSPADADGEREQAG